MFLCSHALPISLFSSKLACKLQKLSGIHNDTQLHECTCPYLPVSADKTLDAGTKRRGLAVVAFGRHCNSSETPLKPQIRTPEIKSVLQTAESPHKSMQHKQILGSDSFALSVSAVDFHQNPHGCA